MAAIDIGPGAVDRGVLHGAPPTYTEICLDNPANDTGSLSSFEIWAKTDLSNVEMGTFYGTAPAYTSRDSEVIGSVASGSKQTFSELDCDVISGDLFGISWTNGDLEAEISGHGGVYNIAGNQFGTGEQTYTLWSGDTLSIYGTGTTAGGETYEVSCTDGLKGGDTGIGSLTIGLSLTDGFKGGDVSPSQLSAQNILSDGGKLGDIPVTQAILQALLTDGGILGDLATYTNLYYLLVSDGIKLGEGMAGAFQSDTFE